MFSARGLLVYVSWAASCRLRREKNPDDAGCSALAALSMFDAPSQIDGIEETASDAP